MGNGHQLSKRKVLNILGIFIFGGFALTNLTNPPYSNELIIESLLFIGASAVLYYLLVNIYFSSDLGGKISLSILILLGLVTIAMIFYFAGQ